MTYLFLILSVLIGALLVLWLKPSKAFVSLLLAFSGAYLLSVTILHLLPEVYEHTEDSKQVGILILIGILIQSVLESFSKGAEHGHIHLHSDKNKFPWLLFVSLCLHAFSEGLPIHSSNGNLLMAVVVHKVPIAIVLTTFLLHTKYSKTIVFSFLGLFSLMSPLGYFIADNIPWLSQHHVIINSLIIGVFLHISTIILFESTENHKFDFKKFMAVLLGILLTVFTLR